MNLGLISVGSASEDQVMVLLKDGQAAMELRPAAGEMAERYRYVVMRV